MLIPTKFDKIFFYRPFIDFRKGVRSLAAIVQDQMGLKPFHKNLFLFCNRKRDKIKVLFWHGTGFTMVYRLLEENKYHWPKHLENEVLYVDIRKLNIFLQGLNPWQTAHKDVFYEKT